MSADTSHISKKLDPPRTGWAGWQQNWKNDLVSGFLVFLIALPLCLGIAMASGVPPMAGIITAIVGGTLVSRLNGSHVTINGPAAGLIVVVLSSVQSLGHGDPMVGYRATLAVIVVASVLQVLMGLLRIGRLNAFFPAAVVEGMLAAIGIIIMAKQVHTLVGVKPESGDILSTIAQIPHSLLHPNPEIAVIGLSGLAIMIVWSIVRNPYLKMIPAPLLVVLSGMGLDKLFDLEHEHKYLFLPGHDFLPEHVFTIGPRFLVSIPDNFFGSFYFPDFSAAGSSEFWLAVVSICLVGSLESILSAMAVDKLDPFKRTSNLDRDLTAVGIGNLVCGLIGGLPMIAEIVRSSANVNNGARTAWANFFHGVFLLLCVGLFPGIIHEIPLASLAALLVYTGVRLASPKAFTKSLEIGREQLALFVITIVGVLATDLLIGVMTGILCKVFLHLIRGVSVGNLFRLDCEVKAVAPNNIIVSLRGSAVFTNYMALKKALMEIVPARTNIVVDLSETYFVDHTVIDFLERFGDDFRRRGGTWEIAGIDNHVPHSSHRLSARIRRIAQAEQ